MKYLTPQDILVIHAQLIDETGGSHSVRDVELLISLTERPKGKFSDKILYKDVFKKAAVYFESLVRHHVFIDGNKRIAVTTAARFLFLNGYELYATNKEVEKFVIDVVIKKHSIKTITAWLKKHSKKII